MAECKTNSAGSLEKNFQIRPQLEENPSSHHGGMHEDGEMVNRNILVPCYY